jgi:protein-disulfide isomerase
VTPPTSKKGSKVPAPPAGAPRARRASPRVLAAAAAAIALVVLGVVLAVVLTGGSSSSADGVPARGSLENALPGASETQELLAGIRQRGNALGSADAPALLVEYVDLQCPYCQEFETQALPDLISRYVRDGRLKVETRVLSFIGPDSERGRRAAIAAGLQNRMSDFVHLLYVNQRAENSGWLDDDMVEAVAASIPGLDVPRLLDDMDSDEVAALAKRFEAQATAAGVNSTPTVLVGDSQETLKPVALTSTTDAAPVAAAIDAALR